MKNPFDQLDKILEHRVRLQIMSVLMANAYSDFNSLKELLSITDGNLAAHLKTLEREKYISISKSFINRKPNTKYKVTEKGKSAFRKHLDVLEELIRQERG